MTRLPSGADRDFMEVALALAALGEGRTSPNPRVGCVVVKDGAIVGHGWHRAAGEPHAEAHALSRAGDAARGATLYVNLEPCSHHGRTPPCADLVAQSGVRRVVASIVDPNPLVDGRGLERLRAAGIEVEIGPGAVDAERLNAPFLNWHRRGRPLVTLKAASTLDGRIAGAGGNATWVTGRSARRFAHRLRYRHDAVLVGAGTVRRDDPRLTVRLPGLRASRIRAVIAPAFDLDPAAKIFSEDHGDGSPRPRLYGLPEASERAVRALADRATIVRVPPGSAPGTVDLAAVLDDLARAGVQSVLVEGGGRTIATFLRARLADEIALFTAPKIFGDAGATPFADGLGTADPVDAWRVEARRRFPVGTDDLLAGRLVPPRGES